jgi:hypothetical protein
MTGTVRAGAALVGLVGVLVLVSGCQTDEGQTQPSGPYQLQPARSPLSPMFPPPQELHGEEAAAVTSLPRGNPQ